LDRSIIHTEGLAYQIKKLLAMRDYFPRIREEHAPRKLSGICDKLLTNDQNLKAACQLMWSPQLSSVATATHQRSPATKAEKPHCLEWTPTFLGSSLFGVDSGAGIPVTRPLRPVDRLAARNVVRDGAKTPKHPSALALACRR